MKLCAHFQVVPCDFRLFLYRDQPFETFYEQIQNAHGYLSGASIKAYPVVVGPVLAILGLSTKIIVGKEYYYVNINSLKKFIYRMFLVMPTATSIEKRLAIGALPKSPLSNAQDQSRNFTVNLKVWAKTMHQRYLDLKESGYNTKILSMIDPNLFLKNVK